MSVEVLHKKKKNVQTSVPLIKQKLQSKITIGDDVPFEEDIFTNFHESKYF